MRLGKKLIELKEGVYRFSDGRVGLNGVSLTIGEGEKVVLLGSNGSGKSTLLRVLGMLYPLQKGSYFFRGEKIGRRVPKRLRREVGLLFQDPESMIFNPTVWDELSFSPLQFQIPNWQKRVEEIAEEVGVAHLLRRNPLELSRGEQQRVMLGAILSYSPSLLLLDEPTSALDPKTTGWFVHFFNRLKITAVIATHDLMMGYQLGERVIVLGENHQILFDGSYTKLLGDLALLERANLISPYPPLRCFCETPYPFLLRQRGKGE
jgi:cobalt/nickel transport system ATP-binding protein